MREELMEGSALDADVQAFADVQGQREEELLDKANVVGVGVANKWSKGVNTGDLAIAVLVRNKEEEGLLDSSDKIPKTLKNLKTDVYEVGELMAGGAGTTMDADLLDTVDEDVTTLSLTQRARPAMGGYSIGHYRITAGTAATGAYELRPFPGKPASYYILSNNHVLANSNNARLGDPILQPGPHDGGRYPADFIGRLERFIPIRFDGTCNYVDAAIAKTRFEWFTREIYYIGYTASLWKPASVGMIVKKTGRTTNFTTGRVTVVNATVNVNYGGGKVGKFCRQILTTDMSAPGDSGSLVLDQANNPIGLLFAGSSVVTIMNPINYVQALLRIRLWP
jgi:hypothetical protein